MGSTFSRHGQIEVPETDSEIDTLSIWETDSEIDTLSIWETDSQIDQVPETGSEIEMASTFSRNGQIEMSSPSHIVVDNMSVTGSEIDQVPISETDSEIDTLSISETDSEIDQVPETGSEIDQVPETGSEIDQVPETGSEIEMASTFSRNGQIEMASTFSRNGQIEMSSPSHTVDVDVEPETVFGIDHEGLEKAEKYGGWNWKDRLEKALKTDIQRGICGENEGGIARRQAVFGSNTYVNPPTESFFHFVRHACKDLSIIILLSCAALSLGFGMKVNGAKEGWIDGLSIFLTVCLVILVSATCNYRRHRQINQLPKNFNDIRCNVVRDEKTKQISISEIVVGDIVVLNVGDQVPANGLLIHGDGYICVSGRRGKGNIYMFGPVFSGTKVVEGYGRILVTSVGVNTEWGKSMAISHNSNKRSHLQDRLDKLNWWNSCMSLIVTVLVTIVVFVYYFTGNTKDENGSTQFKGSKTNIHQVLNSVFSIIRAAVTIQQGLPMTLKLACSGKKILKYTIEEMKHSACERLGGADTICIGRTGSLTTNKIKVKELRIGLGKKTFRKYARMGRYYHSDTVLHLRKILQAGTASNYREAEPDGYELALPDFDILEWSTDEAIFSWACENLNIGEKLLHKGDEKFLEYGDKKVKAVLTKKRGDDTCTGTVHWRGDAETILTMCSSYYAASKKIKIKDLGKNQEVKFKEIIHDAEARGLSCIAFAHKPVRGLEEDPLTRRVRPPTEGLILACLIFVKNPCCPDVKNTIEDFQSAGVNIKMITSDSVFKAKGFARECGILRDGMSETIVRKAEEFQKLSEEERMAICVLAEASSSHKIEMVKYLQEKGQVVAATGDSTDDDELLPLKEANIGILMGDHVSCDAKNSADIIVKDFASILKAFRLGIRLGTCVYNKTQKVIQFQLTANLSALVINFVAALSEPEVPLKAIPLLWTNLVIDTLGALALATEGPTNERTRVRPTRVRPTVPIITNIMWGNILSQAFYQTAVLLVLQFRGKSIFNANDNIRDTLTFNTFILCQIFNMFNSRKLEKKNVFEGIHGDKLFLRIISLSLVLQVLMLEFLNKYTDTERLNWVQWSACVGLAAVSWPIGWVVKFALNYWFKEKIVISFPKKRR